MNALQLDIQKRHTLNWLIQGASEHAGMTFQHLVRDELNTLNPKLVHGYDRLALVGLLQYWRGLSALMMGKPAKFWERALVDPSHPFFEHPLLAKYGGMLADEARGRCLARCREKGVTRLPIALSFKIISIVNELKELEAPHKGALLQLAKGAASMVWGIPIERLDAELTDKIDLPGDMLTSNSPEGNVVRSGVVGLNFLVRGDGEFVITARAINWWILAKELVKGVAELICLHGLNRMDDATYQQVLATTDQFDFEHWMLQTGGELWRRLVQVVPDGMPIANVLMSLARAPAATLHTTMAAVIEQRAEAGDLLAKLGRR